MPVPQDAWSRNRGLPEPVAERSGAMGLNAPANRGMAERVGK